jgi:hypothetical protein
MTTVLSICKDVRQCCDWHHGDLRLFFRGTELELDDSYFSLLHPRWSTGSDNVLIECDSIDEFGIFDGPANFLDHPNISQVNR